MKYKKEKRDEIYGRNNKAITLIALVITIIILLILAAVTLNIAIRRKRNV